MNEFIESNEARVELPKAIWAGKPDAEQKDILQALERVLSDDEIAVKDVNQDEKLLAKMETFAREVHYSVATEMLPPEALSTHLHIVILPNPNNFPESVPEEARAALDKTTVHLGGVAMGWDMEHAWKFTNLGSGVHVLHGTNVKNTKYKLFAQSSYLGNPVNLQYYLNENGIDTTSIDEDNGTVWFFSDGQEGGSSNNDIWE